jgi:predicted RNA-binding Zn ribbon-like protein
MTTLVESRAFHLTGGHAALDLVNTLDWRFREREPDELLASYDDLLGFCEQSGLLAARQARQLRRSTSPNAANRVLREVRETREALAEVFYSQLDGRNPAGAAVRALETFFQEARAHQRLSWSSRRFTWDWSEAENKPEFPLWLLARAASELTVSERIERLRACGDPQCRWLFLDTSKNHTRRWCDMAVCGNRMKARRFKAQNKA